MKQGTNYRDCCSSLTGLALNCYVDASFGLKKLTQPASIKIRPAGTHIAATSWQSVSNACHTRTGACMSSAL
ncbi:hypothetical protein WJX73_000859 [Symbiochloris irregularis]|uniref:Uncharacterized protein n=1 Tax=Symbiochloris irregularis TaxID=706552 RepID=A0AAW1PA50_9CHLO